MTAYGFVRLRPNGNDLVTIGEQSPQRRHGGFRRAHEDNAHYSCGFAAARCGKARPYRVDSKKKKEAAPPNSRQSLLSISYDRRKGKAFPQCAATKPPRYSNRRSCLGSLSGYADFFRRDLGLHK